MAQGCAGRWGGNRQHRLALGCPGLSIDGALWGRQGRSDPTDPDPDDVNVYLERRSEKAVGSWIVSGQFDMVYDGMVMDIKSSINSLVNIVIGLFANLLSLGVSLNIESQLRVDGCS